MSSPLNIISRRRAIGSLAALGLCSLAAVPFVSGCNNSSSGGGGGGGTNGSAPNNMPTTAASASPGGEGGGAGASNAGGKKLHLAFVTNNSSDYWTIARKGTEKAAAELGPNVTVDFKMPAEGTAADQKRVVDDLMVTGVDGMAISPVDPANEVDLLNGVAAKTLLITQDSDAPTSNRVCYVGTDNVAAGKMAGDLIKEALPSGGKVVMFVGKKDAQNAKDRAQGIVDALKGSKIQILDTITDDTDHAKAKANAADILVKDPDVACLVGLWSYNGPAILSAVKDAGKVGKVKIVCFDEEDDTLGGVKDGSIYGTIVQQPYEFGYQSMILMNKYLNGDKTVFPASKQKIIPTKAIKQADVDAFKAKLDELRGRTKS